MFIFQMLLVILYLHIAQCYMSLCPKIVHGMFPVQRTLSAPCSRPRTSSSSFQNYSMHSTYSLLDGEKTVKLGNILFSDDN